MDELISKVRSEELLEELNNTIIDPGHRKSHLLSLYTGDESIGKKYLSDYQAQQALNKEFE